VEATAEQVAEKIRVKDNLSELQTPRGRSFLFGSNKSGGAVMLSHNVLSTIGIQIVALAQRNKELIRTIHPTHTQF
jgi:hypothetical protein